MLFATPVFADDLPGYTEHEKPLQERFCAGMDLEVRTGRGRVDCVSRTHAIEVEFADRWMEAIGQALAYATHTGLRPGIILVCREEAPDCFVDQLTIEDVAGRYALPLTLWLCTPADPVLGACPRLELPLANTAAR